VIDSRLRHLWVVHGGKARRLDEWHEISVVKEFFGRLALRLANVGG
jgi:hypothetical protein